MKFPQRFIINLLLWFILPFFCGSIVVLLTFSSINEIININRLGKDVSVMESRLDEKMMDKLELRRLKIVMGMDDYEEALLKANGKSLEFGEERIVVR